MEKFKKQLSFEERKNESDRLRKKYPNRIPIIVGQAENSKLDNLYRYKFLVPCDITIGQFIVVIRNKIHLMPEKALFLFCENTIPNNSSLISKVYVDFKDKDGFLYITYSGENTFG